MKRLIDKRIRKLNRDQAIVLWMDDDSPDTVFEVDGMQIVPLKSCEELDELLSSDLPVAWAILDFIVPQGMWAREHGLVPTAGRKYLEHLLSKNVGNVRLAVFSMALLPKEREKLLETGVEIAFGKRDISFVDLIGEMRSADSSAQADAAN